MNAKNFQRLLSSIWLGLASMGILVTLVLFREVVPAYNVYRVLDIDLITFSELLVLLVLVFLGLRCAEQVILANEDLWKSDFPTMFDLAIGQLVAIIGYSLFSLGVESLLIPLISLVILTKMRLVLHFKLSKNVSRTVRMGMLSVLVGSLIFFLHEKENEGLHEEYSKVLAAKRDASETLIFNSFAKLSHSEKEGDDPKAFWEARFLSFPYLAANYGLSFRQNNTSRTGSHQVIGAYVDESQPPVFTATTPAGNLLELRQALSLRHSLYLSEAPYRGLNKLSNFEFAVVDRGGITMSNTHVFDEIIHELDLPEPGSHLKIEREGLDAIVYNEGKGRYAILGETLPEFVVLFSNCCFFFSLLLGLHLLFGLVRFVQGQHIRKERWRNTPIEDRFQILVLGTTLLLFFVIAGANFFFLAENNANSRLERQLAIAKEIRTDLLQAEAITKSASNIQPEMLRACFKEEVTDIEVYNLSGKLIASSLATLQNARAPAEISGDIIDLLKKNPHAVKVEPIAAQDDLKYRIYLAAKVSTGELLALAINTSSLVTGTSQDIPVIMSKMLNVYVLLLLLSWLSSLLLISMLTKPLQQVSEKLKNFKLGEKPERINWPSQDAIGKLSDAYNLMAEQAQARSQEIVKKEREGAWQTMAQQIAHEINNSLTPLRLNTQYISMVMSRIDDPDLSGAKKMTTVMVEKIDHLSSVASQFELFANLDKPQIAEVSLVELLQKFKESIETRITAKISLKFEVGNKQPRVFIDPTHFLTVLNKLVKNADQALENRIGSKIELHLQVEKGHVEVRVQDNGPGIPQAIQQRIFDPNFVTTSSNTGLGLPVAWRIIKYFGGDLAFATSEEDGTCFTIILPLVEEPELEPISL